jgi:hypothetical protein
MELVAPNKRAVLIRTPKSGKAGALRRRSAQRN